MADAIVIGLNPSGCPFSLNFNPDPDTLVQPGDEVVLMRPGPFEASTYPPLEHPPGVGLGDWDPKKYCLKSQDDVSLAGEGSQHQALPMELRWHLLSSAG